MQVQTTKFLYGCAIDTWVLDAKWLEDCIQAGSVLPPKKYVWSMLKVIFYICFVPGNRHNLQICPNSRKIFMFHLFMTLRMS